MNWPGRLSKSEVWLLGVVSKAECSYWMRVRKEWTCFRSGIVQVHRTKSGSLVLKYESELFVYWSGKDKKDLCISFLYFGWRHHLFCLVCSPLPGCRPRLMRRSVVGRWGHRAGSRRSGSKVPSLCLCPWVSCVRRKHRPWEPGSCLASVSSLS